MKGNSRVLLVLGSVFRWGFCDGPLRDSVMAVLCCEMVVADGGVLGGPWRGI